jgi:hypothetical protein
MPRSTRLPPSLVSPSRSSADGFSAFETFLPDDDDNPIAGFVDTAAVEQAQSDAKKTRLLRILKEYASRQAEALKVYKPLPHQLRFHSSTAADRVVRGSNRSGKSQCCGAEVAWWMTGCHPHRRVPKENASFMAVGWDWDHIGRVMWPKVGREGSFKMIRDEVTKEWRPVIPDNAYDAAHTEKWKDAPPFLPPRWIKNIAWECKGKDQPAIIECVNGSKLRFASSAGAPKQGDEIDGWWADEELDNERWIAELQRGCVKRRGSGFYSATPLAASIQLFEMHRRATDPQKKHDIEEFHLLISDNIYIGKKEKETFFKQLLTPQDIRVRWYGEFAMSGLVVYPEWAPDQHVIEPFEVPHYWSRYMIVDPGVQVCAVLFAAIPPEEELFTAHTGVPYKHRGTVHIYDELYIERCTASLFAKKVAEKMGDRKRGEFEAFVIDHSMGRQAELGSGRTVEIQYSDALAEEHVYSRVTGSGFLWGNDDIDSRTEALRRWMMPRPDTGKPTIHIHSRCPKLIWEMGQQFFKKDKATGIATTKRRDVNNHAVSCLEYFADLAPDWTPPKKAAPRDSWAVEQLRLKRRRPGTSGGGSISLGPS